MAKRVGLKDIAKELNVSITTVSRALNDKFDINPQTRDLILQKAKELNYIPNAHAVSLRKNEIFTIGVILPSVDHYFFATLLAGIMNKAHAANYMVIVATSEHNPKQEKEVIEQLTSQMVTGIIMSPTTEGFNDDNIKLLKEKRIPFIVVDRPIANEDHSYVKYDDLNGAYLAVQHLAEQGYQKIGFIKGPDYCTISSERLIGYKRALKDFGLIYNEHLVKSCSLNNPNEDGYLASKQMLLSNTRPDAIFTITDEIATGVYQAAKELNISLPNDLGVVGYSNSKLSAHMNPTLTTIEQPGEKMGEQAFDYLQTSIISGRTNLERTFEARLIVRESSIKVHASNKAM